ncbi:MAG: response regulator transcription factor [Actinomycetota bacterium]|nr:response regulator transcription factor [Actinomycetota bacterium]
MPDVNDDTRPVRVAVVDDDALVRSALTLMLGGRDDITVVGEATDGDEVAELVRSTRPDIVLMDVRMRRMNGIDATALLLSQPEPPRVIVLTTFDTDDHVLDALAAGAQGFLVKDTAPEDLVAAITTVAAGESILSPSVTTTVVAHLRAGETRQVDPTVADRLARLTAREHEVAVAVGRGLSNAEVASELFMSVATVKAHVSHVFEKLEVANRVQVALLMHDAGLA